MLVSCPAQSVVLMKVTTSRIPHHLGSGLLSRRVICRYRNMQMFPTLVKFWVVVAFH